MSKESSTTTETLDRRAVFSWAMYDWANSAYAASVMVVFAPILFTGIWAAELGKTDSTFRWGVISSITSAIIAVLAPVLGAVADRCGRRKGLLLTFAFIGAAATIGLSFIAHGHWQLAAVVYIISGIGFSGANVFYDSLIVSVAPASVRDRVSALGYAFGYLGGGLMLAAHVFLVLRHDSFHLTEIEAQRVCIITSALWWIVFCIPLWRCVRETAVPHTGIAEAVRRSFGEVVGTIRQLRQNRPVLIFLLAYWLYIDGVDTIIRMAVPYGKNIGVGDADLIKAILLTQFIAFPAAILFGRMGEWIGTRRSILIAIGCYIAITAWAASMKEAWEFYVLAAAVGLVQGGIQSLSRSIYSRLIPPEKASEYFGLYNLLGKSAAVIGPLLMGGIAVATDNDRIGILSILVLFIAGGALLLQVREDAQQ